MCDVRGVASLLPCSCAVVGLRDRRLARSSEIILTFSFLLSCEQEPLCGESQTMLLVSQGSTIGRGVAVQIPWEIRVFVSRLGIFRFRVRADYFVCIVLARMSCVIHYVAD